ncbi:hypothetical protein Gogos_014290 [Gossypium gossypioides]|uniref:Uncharacterized protein n=1 Tax=Gossypium gossypioides TaxID=34282 RepID=A0A7J9BY43_GOSGO|nr:hypothetical protein [Gossypium gossypioides]
MKQFGSTTFQGIQDTKLLQILMESSSNQTGHKIRDYSQIQLVASLITLNELFPNLVVNCNFDLKKEQVCGVLRLLRKIAVSFPGFPWRFSRGASKEKQPVVKGASLNSGNSSSDWGAKTVKFQTKISGNGKWQGSEERRVIDKEFDVVVVPSDGIHLSGYESDGPLGGKNPSALAFMVMKMMVDTLFSFLVINVVTRSL